MSENSNSNSSLNLEIISPDNAYILKDQYMVVMPGSEGEFGVLEGHVPLIAILESGTISIYNKAMQIIDRIIVSQGYAEVTGDSIMVLTESFSKSN